MEPEGGLAVGQAQRFQPGRADGGQAEGGCLGESHQADRTRVSRDAAHIRFKIEVAGVGVAGLQDAGRDAESGVGAIELHPAYEDAKRNLADAMEARQKGHTAR